MNKIGVYELESELSHTRMAATYIARDPKLDRKVVVKYLAAQSLNDPTIRARYQREVQLIAALEHPAIVPILEYGEQDERPFIVMPYLTGGSLAQILSAGPLSYEQALTIIERACSALSAVHSLGIVHANIKPSNILVDADGLPFLSDFGMVKLAEASIESGADVLLGPPAYISPEQARGEAELDGRSDVYMLGVLLFEILTGQLPYLAETPLGYAVQHISLPPPNILELRPDLPAPCQAIVAKALARNPAKRFASVGEFAEAFAQLSLAPSKDVDSVTLAGNPKRPKPELIKLSQRVGRQPPDKFRQAKKRSTAWGIIGFLALVLAVLSSLFALGEVGQGPLAKKVAVVITITSQPSATITPSPSSTRNIEPSATRSPTSTLTGTEPPPVSTEIQFTPTARLAAILPTFPPIEISSSSSITSTYIYQNIDTLFGVSGRFQIDFDRFLRVNYLRCTDQPSTNVELLIPGFEAKLLRFAPPEVNPWNVDQLAPSNSLSCMQAARLVDFSDDGKLLAVAKAKSVYIWRVGDWVPVHEFKHSAKVLDLDFSPDSSMIVTGSEDTLVYLWSLKTGQEVIQPLFNHQGPVSAVAFSPTGEQFVTGSTNGSVITWDVQGNLISQKREGEEVVSLAVSPVNTNILAIAFPGSVGVYNFDQISFQYALPVSGESSGLAFSPDGQLLASNRDVWHVSERRTLYKLGPAGNGVSFSRDSQLILTGNRVSWVTNGKPLIDLVDPQNTSKQIGSGIYAFSPLSNLVASASDSGLTIWALPEGTDSSATGHPRPYIIGENETMYTVANRFEVNLESFLSMNELDCASPIFSSQNVLLPNTPEAALQQTDMNLPEIRVEEKDRIQILRSLSMVCNRVAVGLDFSGDSQKLITGSALWNLTSGAIQIQAEDVPRRLDGSPEKDLASPILDLSIDGSLLAIRIRDRVQLWDAAQGTLIKEFPAMKGLVSSVAFSPDGKWLAASSLISGSSSGENEIRVWDVDSSEVVWVNPGIAVNHIEFASDGKTLLLQGMNAVRVWKIGDTEPLYSIQGVEKDLEISPDGNYLAYVTCEGNRKVNNHCVTETAQVVNILEAQFSFQFNGLTSEIQNLEFSNDGQALAGASGNGIVIWSLTGDILHTLKVTDSRDESQNLAFSPTQPVFISTDESGRMRIWNLETDSLERTISEAKIRELGFAPDGRSLVAISGEDINIWGIPEQQQ